jgi:hypothetical protein
MQQRERLISLLRAERKRRRPPCRSVHSFTLPRRLPLAP